MKPSRKAKKPVNVTHLRGLLGGDKPISQDELASRLGVSQQTVSRLETGEREQDGPLGFVLRRIYDEAVAATGKDLKVANAR